MGFPVIKPSDIPQITTDQMVEVDRLMVEEYGIQMIQMMENAGSCLAELAIESLYDKSTKTAVCCGAGNNGGGGLVTARHLINRGIHTEIFLTQPRRKFKGIPLHQLSIVEKLTSVSFENPDFGGFDLIIDAMIGYGIKGNPRGTAAEWIRLINQSNVPVISLDSPSGLDLTTGLPGAPCIKAIKTMTLALPKVGLFNELARISVGDLYLADISVPAALYKSMGIIPHPFFEHKRIIRIQ